MPRSVRRTCYYSKHRHGWSGDESIAVFATETTLADPPTVGEASDVVAESGERYATEGARAEFCRTLGVHYDRYLRCAATVRSLERSLDLDAGDILPMLPPPMLPPPMRVAGGRGFPKDLRKTVDDVDLSVECINDDYGLVRVRVKWLSEEAHATLERFGRCPLCLDVGHSLRMCPHLPDELRPFS